MKNKIRDSKNLIPLSHLIDNLSEQDRSKVKTYSEYYEALIAIREVRRKLGLTQIELAKRSGLAQETISRIESGKRNVSIETLMAISSAMGKRLKVSLV